MRIEELANNQYLKGTDQVERYLLNLIRMYFADGTNTAQPESREYIVRQAVERMKEEITFDNTGVLSVILPSGEERIGAVSLTLQDLNGEPAITTKRSAFNVPFGIKQNTACEGNDPRLSDARIPLSHTHDISEINGLDGRLSTLDGMLNRGLALSHGHSNKDVLDIITYSGSKTSIDLAELEEVQGQIEQIVNNIYNSLTQHKQDIESKISNLNTQIAQAKQQTDDIETLIINQQQKWYNDSKTYTDNEIASAKTTVDNELLNYVKKTDVQPVANVVDKTYILAGKIAELLSAVTPHTATDITSASTLYQDMSVNNELADAIIECNMKAGDKTYALPYIIMDNGVPTGSISYRRTANHNVEVLCEYDTMPGDLYGAKIEVSYFKLAPSIII